MTQAAPPGRKGSWIPGWLALTAVLGAGFALRAAYYDVYYSNPDEAIAVAVVGHMRSSGDWDTNWAKADLGPAYRYDQYNFSSYHFAVFLFYRLAKAVPALDAWRSMDAGFLLYRFFSVLLAAIAVGQAAHLAFRIAGMRAAIAAGVFTAAAPLLVQDAHYVRPEAFEAVLTLLLVDLCLPSGRAAIARAAGAGVLVGILVACKVSMLLLAWLPFVPLLGCIQGRSWRLGAGAAGTLAAMAAGFIAGVPGAVLHPAAFRNGVRALVAQYSGLHPPHGHFNGGPVADLLADYFASTLGWPLLAAAIGGCGLLAFRRKWTDLLVCGGPIAVFAGYFAAKPVFFERNLSHVVPLACVLAGVGAASLASGIAARTRLGTGASAAVLACLAALIAAKPVGVAWPMVTRVFSGSEAQARERFEDEERRRFPAAEWRMEILLGPGPLDSLAAHFAAGGAPVLLRVSEFHDEWSPRFLSMLTRRFDAVQIGDWPGDFPTIPVCTLLTYASPHNRYFLVRGMR